MLIYELAAIGAATCWALTGLFSAWPAGHLGALAFNCIRQVFVTALLALVVLATGTWDQITPSEAWPLIVSGVIGIFVGDTILFVSLNRVGPRRAGILFAMSAPMTVILGWVFLNESLSLLSLAGILLILAGVSIAIAYRGVSKSNLHPWEQVKGPLWIGVSLGLLAALAQAIGSIIAKPVMETGFDPVAGSLLRVGAAAACLSSLSLLPIAAVKPRNPLNWRVTGMTMWTGFLSIALGMTLLLFALSGGKAGIVSTLSATSPIIILPMLWFRTGEQPSTGAWIGAALVVTGMGLVFFR